MNSYIRHKQSTRLNAPVQEDILRAFMNTWPPRCCVAAFISDALNEFGVVLSHDDGASIARELGTRVGAKDANPWNLEVTDDDRLRGVTPTTALRLAPLLLRGYHGKLSFRHIPMSTISLEQYVEVFNAALGRGCVVGMGFDYSIITGEEGPIPHVARLFPGSSGEIVYLSSIETSCDERHSVSWEILVASSISLGDGFWIVGETSSLNFPYTLPHAAFE